MSAKRTAMIAGACVVLGAWNAEARAELHRLAFRGQLGEIPTPLDGSPLWAGIAPGDPMLISCVLDTSDEVTAFDQLGSARLISVSLVIGGRFESTDGTGSTIRGILEEGISRADVAGAHRVEFDLVLPSGVRVVVNYVQDLGGAIWAIGDTSGQVRLSSKGPGDRLANPLDPATTSATFGQRERLAAMPMPTNAPAPGGIAVFAPALVLLMRRRRG